MDRKSYQVGLTISHRGKGIPYGGYHDGEINEDGTPKNRGFKNLKGRPDRLQEVPELEDTSGLYELVELINRPENGLVSIGCAGWDMSDANGHRWGGYVEFAINSAELVQDAQSYFPIFFHFDRMLHESAFDETVNYHWELEPAHFSPANVEGFTCAVHVYTPPAASVAEAKGAWQAALGPLTSFLRGFSSRGGTPLFSSETNCDLR
jgi:hypothetical protein